MIDIIQIRDYWVRPALTKINAWSEAAEQLVIGTGLVESSYQYIKQLNNGPALGFWQMEPATAQDIMTNFVAYKPDLYANLKELMIFGVLPVDQLSWNMQFAAAMCRIHYLRAPQPVPAAGDMIGLAGYHKKYYNTALGAADITKNIDLFEQVIQILGRAS